MKYILPLALVITFAFTLNSCRMNTTEPDFQDPVSLNKGVSGNAAMSIILNCPVDNSNLKSLSDYGKILDVVNEINAVRILAKESSLSSVLSLPFVKEAGFDSERKAPKLNPVPVEDFLDGVSTWNLDALNVTNIGINNRVTDYDGEGTVILILDTGLMDSWRQYFPQERILSQYAKSFSGGGSAGLNISEQPNRWEHDQCGHGTHIASTIIGYEFNGKSINGVAPLARIIPVKVLGNDGSGWSSVIAEGLIYAADLKEKYFSNQPFIVNMSFGGATLDVMEKAAIDYAISKGVILVACAGNTGTNGMVYPGGYAPVISSGSAGPLYAVPSMWIPSWWFSIDVPESVAGTFSVSDFSASELQGQDLDVIAPGELIMGPLQLQSGKLSYFLVSGTSSASAHVAGLTALLLQKEPALTQSQVEEKLESAAIDLPAYPSSRKGSGFITADALLQ